MHIVNLTPHTIRFIQENKDGSESEALYLSTGSLRAKERYTDTLWVDDSKHKGIAIPIMNREYEPVDMPVLEFNTIYIVSSVVKDVIRKQHPMVANAFIVPNELIKNEAGSIIGCASFRL